MSSGEKPSKEHRRHDRPVPHKDGEVDEFFVTEDTLQHFQKLAKEMRRDANIIEGRWGKKTWAIVVFLVLLAFGLGVLYASWAGLSLTLQEKALLKGWRDGVELKSPGIQARSPEQIKAIVDRSREMWEETFGDETPEQTKQRLERASKQQDANPKNQVDPAEQAKKRGEEIAQETKALEEGMKEALKRFKEEAGDDKEKLRELLDNYLKERRTK